MFFFLLLFSTETSMVEVWNERFPLPDNDFEFLEPLLALRTSMLLTLVKLRTNKSSSREGLVNLARAYKDLATHLEMQAKVARRSHNPQVQFDVYSCLFILVLSKLFIQLSLSISTSIISGEEMKILSDCIEGETWCINWIARAHPPSPKKIGKREAVQGLNWGSLFAIYAIYVFTFYSRF